MRRTLFFTLFCLIACGREPGRQALAKLRTATFAFANPPLPDVVFVVDRSAAMADSPDGSVQGVCPAAGNLGLDCKWNQLLSVTTGQDSIVRAVASRARPSEPIRIGLVTASGAGDSPTGFDEACTPGVLAVPLQGGSSGEIESALLSLAPSGAAPLASAVLLAGAALQQQPSAAERFVVLLTGGAPDCNAQLAPTDSTCAGERCTSDCDPGTGLSRDARGCLDEAGLIQAIQALSDSGIRTLVVGFGAATPGTAVYETLDAAAIAGGMAQSAEPRFVRGDSPQQLDEAFPPQNVTQSCIFALDPAPTSPELVEVNATFCGQAPKPLASEQFAVTGSTLAITDATLCQQLQNASSTCPNGLSVAYLAN